MKFHFSERGIVLVNVDDPPRPLERDREWVCFQMHSPPVASVMAAPPVVHPSDGAPRVSRTCWRRERVMRVMEMTVRQFVGL